MVVDDVARTARGVHRRFRTARGVHRPFGAAWLLLLTAVLAIGLAGCASGSTTRDGRLLTYERVQSDGRRDDEAIYPDGRLLMHHGESLERLTLAADEVKLIQDALAAEIPTGTPGDGAKRTLTLADGKVIKDPLPEPGSVTELLDRLLDTHSLGESMPMDHG